MKTNRLFPACVAVFLFLCAGDLYAYPVDFKDFTATPSTDVSFSAGWFSAIISEDNDTGLNPVSLRNDALPIPAQAARFSFDYVLEVPGENKDFFDFYIGDLSERAFESGGRGPFTVSGHFSYDLTEFSGATLPVLFHLMSDWEDAGFGSQVTISQVQVSAIPVPSALLLLASGLLGLAGARRKFPDRRRRIC